MESVLALTSWLLLASAGGTVPPSQEILAKVCDTTARRHAVTYSGMRQYTLHNMRFSKEATVSAKVTSRPGEGKHFTVVQRSGTDRLIKIIEKLIASETESSRPSQREHVIGPSNYDAVVRRSETIAGRDCYVLDVTPKEKSKYVIKGTMWVDKRTFGIVRLDGRVAESLSIWVGTPHVVEDFAQVSGIWLPAHTHSVSATFLLGESRLEIRYSDYQVNQ